MPTDTLFPYPSLCRAEAARTLGLPVKLHADQLSDGAGAALVAEFGGLSADHVDHTSVAGVAAMAEAGTVAVLLTGAFHVLRATPLPPLRHSHTRHVPKGVATHGNHAPKDAREQGTARQRMEGY